VSATAGPMRIASIVGARPQFIKAGPVSAELRKRHKEILIHTGQHYDPEMSANLFAECGLAEPDFNLGVGSGPHGRQTADMLAGLEEVLQDTEPDFAIVYGDTNSTLAGALAAAKLGIPAAHVEAGMRSGEKDLPEEINRIVADHLCRLLLAPTAGAVENLRAEGLTEGVRMVGDVMVDALELAKRLARETDAVGQMGLHENEFLLLTIHRAGTADSAEILEGILGAVDELGAPVVFPAHPRTRGTMERAGLGGWANVRIVPPVGHAALVGLAAAARCVLTDSGGVQKEAYLLGTPCVTLRKHTEWTETLAGGWNALAGTEPAKIAKAAARPRPTADRPPVFGDGHAAERIARAIEEQHRAPAAR